MASCCYEGTGQRIAVQMVVSQRFIACRMSAEELSLLFFMGYRLVTVLYCGSVELEQKRGMACSYIRIGLTSRVNEAKGTYFPSGTCTKGFVFFLRILNYDVIYSCGKDSTLICEGGSRR